MRGRSSIALCVLALLHAQTAPAQAPVKVSVSMVGSIAQGQSATITWTVTGTTEPVRLRLYNTSPGVGTLSGGNVQIAVTSGGTPNAVSRTVTGVAPGTFDVTVEIDDGRPPSSAWLSAALRQELLNAAATLERGAAALPVRRVGLFRRSVIQRADVVALLRRVEAELRTRLPFPELAAFHDAVSEILDMYRAELMGMTSAHPAAMREQEARSLVSRIASWFRSKAELSPVSDVCVRTNPTAATVLLYPRSFPSARHTGRSATILTLYLGRYEYEIGHIKGSVNFLENARRVIECELRDQPGCNVVDGAPEACQ